MSSIVLLKDHAGSKKGDTISAPFGKARDMVRDGLGRYPEQKTAPMPAKPDPRDIEIESLRKQVKDLQQQVEALTAPPMPSTIQTAKK